MNASTTNSTRTARTANTSRTLGLACAAGLAISLACTRNAAAQSFHPIPLPTDMQELRPIGISGTGSDVVIPFKAINEPRVQVYEMAGVWTGGIAHLAPNPVGSDGLFQDLVNIQYRAMPARGQTIPGIDVVIRKTPADKAMYWDTRSSDEGVLVELGSDIGIASWPGGLNADGSLITGAVYGDLDASGEETRAAVRWVNGGMAELLPVPADSQHSEVFGTSPDGTSVGCYKAIKEHGVQRNEPRMIPTEGASGMVWHSGGTTVISPSIAGNDAQSIVLTTISDGGGVALAAISTTRSNQKGGLIADLSGSNSWLEPNLDFTLLDAGDINGDGLVDLMDDHDSSALALSADGSVVGGSVTLFGQQMAALWIKGAGGAYEYHDVGTYLSNLGSTGNDGWTLLEVTGVSVDCSMITGVGLNPLGQTTGWYASIPSPGALSLLGLGGLLASRRRR